MTETEQETLISMNDLELSSRIRLLAHECGFSAVSIAEARRIDSADRMLHYIDRNYYAGMDFFQRNIDKRLDPSLLLEGARSVICLAASCSPEVETPDSPISCFYRGRDYHRVMKKRCRSLCDRIMSEIGDFKCKICVDSVPVAERALAAASGLGWIGKNGMLIVPGIGNTVVLAEIITDLELEYGSPHESRCDCCNICLNACPTGALRDDGYLDANLCISYHTIENRGTIPAELWPLMGGSVFGCDICRNACPRSSVGPSGDRELSPTEAVIPTIREILAWEDADWDEATRGKGLRRAKLWMFHRNAAIAAGNSDDTGLIPLLLDLKLRGGPVAEIDWAIAQLSGQ